MCSYVNRECRSVPNLKKLVRSKRCPSDTRDPQLLVSLRVGSLEPFENSWDTRKLESSSYHAPWCLFETFNAFLRTVTLSWMIWVNKSSGWFKYNSSFRGRIRIVVLRIFGTHVNDLCAASRIMKQSVQLPNRELLCGKDDVDRKGHIDDMDKAQMNKGTLEALALFEQPQKEYGLTSPHHSPPHPTHRKFPSFDNAVLFQVFEAVAFRVLFPLLQSMHEEIY
ncbi:hypothetical protein Tco_0196444 [Tanacetum coccineum]